MSKGTRIPLDIASQVANTMLEKIREIQPLIDIRIGGSIARKRPDCGDIDLCMTESDFYVMQEILKENPICSKLEFTKGTKKKPGRLSHAFQLLPGGSDSIKIEFYIGKDNALGAIQLFCNGSGKFNVRQRRIAMAKGFKLSQYGLFNAKGELVAGKTEEEIFEALGMKFLTPQEREEG